MGLIDRDFALDRGERVITLKIDAILPDHTGRYKFAHQSLRDLPGQSLGTDISCCRCTAPTGLELTIAKLPTPDRAYVTLPSA